MARLSYCIALYVLVALVSVTNAASVAVSGDDGYEMDAEMRQAAAFFEPNLTVPCTTNTIKTPFQWFGLNKNSTECLSQNASFPYCIYYASLSKAYCSQLKSNGKTVNASPVAVGGDDGYEMDAEIRWGGYCLGWFQWYKC